MRRNVPLVEQIVLEILAAIDSGELAQADGALPSETDLSTRYGVSRATVREALGKLESAGVVMRRHGIGTFVNPFMLNETGLQDWFEEAHGFVDSIRSLGGQPEVRLVHLDIEPAGRAGQHLQMTSEDPAIVIEKVITSDGTPMIHSVNVIPLALVPAEVRERAIELAAACDSTFRFLETHCHTRVHHQQSQVRAGLMGDQLAALLDCRPGDPCLEVEETAYSIELQPLFYGINHFRGDKVSFRQIRRPTLSLAGVLTAAGSDAVDNSRR